MATQVECSVYLTRLHTRSISRLVYSFHRCHGGVMVMSRREAADCAPLPPPAPWPLGLGPPRCSIFFLRAPHSLSFPPRLRSTASVLSRSPHAPPRAPSPPSAATTRTLSRRAPQPEAERDGVFAWRVPPLHSKRWNRRTSPSARAVTSWWLRDETLCDMSSLDQLFEKALELEGERVDGCAQRARPRA